MVQGRFLSFEGIDGSGKSTQARLLAASLRDMGQSVALTREPGGSPGAEEIRRLVLEGDPARWSAETEILLFTAARRDHMEKTIRPALDRGDVVITDRFADSTRMYQGISRGDLAATVDQLHALMIGLEPDLTLLIDIDPALGLSRAVARSGPEQRFEDMGLDLQRAMRSGFLALAKAHPARFRVIDGARPPEAVAADVLACARAHLGL
ncbi:dTMP kinase [Gemmobacter fulvus]|uniref:Thymidylate kinase n=1 Tax=Gemmobacter fulvus TaxID=2840474 RepID=A0A975S162_9RHOB|nr:dTMP kinase [Gemmobacter fulvus]MBT9245378.1 dTMP kinase [Gemmobacter fulvus]QWK90307.1 dTMP kinase [Gemmobacter fulvus]